VENIVYKNMTLTNIAKQAITIDMFYDVGGNPNVDQSGAEGVPVIRNVFVENLKCDSAATAIVVRGLPESPMTGIALSDIEITAKEGVTITGAPDVRVNNLVVKHSQSPTTKATEASR
jgi:DNA sulfur modification protein DndE